MLYSLEVAARSRSSLQAAVGAYDEVQVRRAGDVDLAGGATLTAEPVDVDDDVDAGEGEREGERAEDDGSGGARRRTASRGDDADELGVDDREATDEVPESSPWWDADPGPERGSRDALWE